MKFKDFSPDFELLDSDKDPKQQGTIIYLTRLSDTEILIEDGCDSGVTLTISQFMQLQKLVAK